MSISFKLFSSLFEASQRLSKSSQLAMPNAPEAPVEPAQDAPAPDEGVEESNAANHFQLICNGNEEKTIENLSSIAFLQ